MGRMNFKGKNGKPVTKADGSRYNFVEMLVNKGQAKPKAQIAKQNSGTQANTMTPEDDLKKKKMMIANTAFTGGEGTLG